MSVTCSRDFASNNFCFVLTCWSIDLKQYIPSSKYKPYSPYT